MKTIPLLLTLLILTGCMTAKTPLRVVCIGDSLTACGGPGGRYTDWLAAWMPEAEIINKGIGGNTLAQGRARYQQDILDLNPNVVVIELGANDFWRAKRPLDELAADLDYMVSAARHAGAQVVIASCFGDAGNGDASPEFQEDVHARYACGIAQVEQDVCIRYACFYVPNMQFDIKPVVDYPQYWGDDRHPNKAGNELVARRIFAELEKAMAAARHGR